MRGNIETSSSDLASTLQKIGNYDKDLRMIQASVRQAHKDIKSLSDNLGEQVFNLEEKTVGNLRVLESEGKVQKDIQEEKMKEQTSKN